MKNIMLDLETMGNGSNAAIVSIGAVFFDPLTGELGDEPYYQVVDLNDSAKFGELDGSTVSWWMQQSDAARSVFADERKTTLQTALKNFSYWIEEEWQISESGKPKPVVWGNGATFDNVILSNAYKATNLPKPWFFANDRDVRTIVDLGRQLRGIDPKKDLELGGTAHNALDDAKFQVRYVSEIFKALADVSTADDDLSIIKITGKPELLNDKWYVSCLYKPRDETKGWAMVFDSKEEALSLKVGDTIK